MQELQKPRLIQDLGMKYFGNQGKKTRYGFFECPICFKNFETRTTDVKIGKSTKCKSCATRINTTIHGLKQHRLYNTWINMKKRIFNKKSIGYENYGGRGINICDRWLKIENFIEDMYPSYQEGLTLDRMDNDGNYEPSNCRWATKSVQSRNTIVLRSTNTSGYRGVYFKKKNNKFCTRIALCGKFIQIGYFKTAEEAGYAYDKYVIENNLEHTTNGLYIKSIK